MTPIVLAFAACTGEAQPPGALPPLPPRIERQELAAPTEPAPLREAIIAFTAEVRAEIEPCGCPTVPYGGFRRRARLIDALREEGPSLYVLDAGELLVKGLSAAETADRTARARAVLDLSLRTGLDAWAPAPVDLVPGGLALVAGSGALSANWRDGGGEEVLPGSVILERDGVRVGVVGLSAPARTGLGSGDPVESVRAAMRGDADTWLVLSNAALADNVRVAENVPGLGAVLSVRGERHDPPRATAGAPIIESPDRGRYVTVIRLSLGTGAHAWQLPGSGPWKELAELRALATRQEGEALAATKRRIDAARAEVAKATAGHNVAWVEDRALGSDLDGESVVDDTIAAFKERSTQAARDRADRRPTVAGYATASACASCHKGRFAAWAAAGGHSRAHESLMKRGAAGDPECVGCHTTGWGEAGGYAEASDAALRTWKGVQCEACHGPLAGHPDPAVTPRPVTVETCTRCHDEANSPSFDFASYLKRTSCWTQSLHERGP